MTRSELKNLLNAYGGHFSVEELLATPEHLDRDTLIKLLEWRQWHGYPMLITSAYRNGDLKAHGKGLAFDIILFEKGKFKEQTLSDEHQYRLAEAFGWKGIGVYYDWKLTYKNGETDTAIDLHVDMLSDTNKRPLRWIRNNGEYHYLNFATGRFGSLQAGIHLLFDP